MDFKKKTLNLNKSLFSLLFFCLSSVTYADLLALKNFEKQIIRDYKDADYFEVNGDIEQRVSSIIADDPTSFSYDFPLLQDAGYVHIQYSPDRKLKFYNFNLSTGGTMGEASNYVQYKINQITLFDEFNAGYHITDIKQVRLNNRPVYFVESYYKGDSCHGLYALRAVEVGKKQLLKSYIFKAKTKTNHEIQVDFDCGRFLDPSHVPDYFRIQPKSIDVILLNRNGEFQNKYLRYQLKDNGYVYQGVVK